MPQEQYAIVTTSALTILNRLSLFSLFCLGLLRNLGSPLSLLGSFNPPRTFVSPVPSTLAGGEPLPLQLVDSSVCTYLMPLWAESLSPVSLDHQGYMWLSWVILQLSHMHTVMQSTQNQPATACSASKEEHLLFISQPYSGPQDIR